MKIVKGKSCCFCIGKNENNERTFLLFLNKSLDIKKNEKKIFLLLKNKAINENRQPILKVNRPQ